MGGTFMRHCLQENTLIEQSQYSEKQCSELLSYVCVVINKKI